MRYTLLAIAFTSALLQSAGAQQVNDTTLFGVTITQDQIAQAIEETQEFWPGVKKHIVSDQFPVADLATRQKTVDFLKTVHDDLHDRLFEADEATATDLVDYLTLRLCKFELYRKLRPVIGDDAVFVRLIDRWERAHRDVNALPAAERAARHAAVLAMMPDEMAASGLTAEQSAKAMELWRLQSECMARMTATDVGQKMLEFEREAKKADRALSELIRNVAFAADWALIVKDDAGAYGCPQFIAAWDDVASLKAKQRTVAKPGVTNQ